MSKTRKYVILSTIITALCLTFIVVGSKPVQAKTYYTSQYSITSAFENFEALSSNGCLSVHITINFNDYYTGTMRLGLTNTYSVDYNIIMYNAKLSAKSTSYFTIVFDQVKNIDIYLVLKASDYYGSIGTTGAAIANYFVGNWSTLFDINTVNNVSISVDSPVDDIVDGITDIYTDIEVLKGYVNLLLENSNNIESDVNSINTQLITLLSNAESYQDYNIPLYMYPAVLLFDTLYDLEYDTTLSLPRFNVAASSSFTWNSYIKLDSNDIYFVYYMKLGSINNFTYTAYSGHPINKTRNFISETSTYRLYYDILKGVSSTEYLTPTSSSAYQIIPIYLGVLNQMPSEVREILNINTNTVSSIISAKDAIVNALQNLNITSDNDTEINNYVTANDNSITTITNNHETVNNITNDFNLDFGTADNAITLDIDSLPDLTNTATFWNGKAGDLDIELGDFHYPIWLGFVLLAIMAMIGV